jgi:peptidoglycan/xylan/chitin deacetylase (PgdA/CDA1 family)
VTKGKKKSFLLIFGTGPEAIKLAPLARALKEIGKVRVCVTGQHREMLDQVLDFFSIRPDYDLNVMKKNQGLFSVTAKSLLLIEKAIDDARPDFIIIQGDTTTAFVGALARYYKQVKVAHVEAGLRSFSGKENLWDSGEGKAAERLMDWDAVLRLNKEGVAFGSHTRSHPFLSTLSGGKIGDEVAGSKSVIEERLQKPVDAFCYPYGDYDERVLQEVNKAGYKAAVTIKRGLVHRNDSPVELRRSFIRLTTHPLLFMYKIHSLYEDRKGARP